MLLLLLLQAPGGIYVEADGAVKTREVDVSRRLAELRKSKARPETAYVSLPRLFAAGGERFLGGMTRVRYVFVFPEEGDLVLAGPAEEIDLEFPGRPVGKRTGRPALQVDDLVVALRTSGAFGVSIEFADGAQDRMAEEYEKHKAAIAKEADQRRGAYDKIAEAAGPQKVEFFGIEPSTRFAWVCLEADVLLKRHSLGLDPTPVRAAPSVLDLIKKKGALTDRTWFELGHDPIGVSEDGNAFELRGPSLKVLDKTDGGSTSYAEKLTANLPKLAEAIPAWADLENLADLAVVAALIRADGLDRRAGWDLDAALRDYKVPEVPVAKTVPTSINFKTASSFLVVVKGGVLLEPEAAASRRETRDLSTRASRPAETWVERQWTKD